MTFDEARAKLAHDIFADDGTFVQLRLGNDPGKEAISRLRLALRILWRELSAVGTIPRDVAFACGSIIHFADEAIQNTERSIIGRTEKCSASEMAILDLAQGAFDVLAGAAAQTVPRVDLGESGSERQKEEQKEER
jgi:hypothetical protein